MQTMTDFNGIIKEWLEYKKPSKRPTTMARYRWLAQLIERDKLGALEISDVKNRDLQAFSVRLASEIRPDTGKPYGKNTIINALQVAKMAHKYAAINGYCAPMVYSIDLPRTHDYYTADKLKSLTPAQAEILMGKLSCVVENPSHVPWSKRPVESVILIDNNRRYALGAIFGLACGLRIGEVCAIDVNKHIDLLEGQVHIDSTVVTYQDNGVFVNEIGPPKSPSSVRMVPIPPRVISLLETHIPKKGYLIPLDKSTRGVPNKRGLSTWYSRLMHSIEDELPYVSFHGLRHSYATRLLQRGADFKTVAELLGHADVVTTMRIYAHPDDHSKTKLIDSSDW